MASIRTLRTKVKSVKSTQQITKAMKLVAAARLNRAQERIMSARPFSNKLETLLQSLTYLLSQSDDQNAKSHPFYKGGDGNRVDLVLVTADRGLCGGFNSNVIRRAMQFMKEHEDQDVRLWVVGKKGRDFFRRTNVKLEKEYINIFQRLGFHQAEILGQDLINEFSKGKTRQVIFIYNEFKSRLQQRLMTKLFLPIRRIPEVQPRQDFIYEPSKREIFIELLPWYIKSQIYRMLLESASAELAARMTAMENATQNAGEVIDSLTSMMNKIRQASVTKEISEIVGGAEALQTT